MRVLTGYIVCYRARFRRKIRALFIMGLGFYATTTLASFIMGFYHENYTCDLKN